MNALFVWKFLSEKVTGYSLATKCMKSLRVTEALLTNFWQIWSIRLTARL